MTTTVDMRNAPAEAKCFRPRRYNLIVGVVGVVYFSVLGVASTVAADWNLDRSFPRPTLFALIFGLFWSGWTLLSVWVVLAYFRERLFLAGKTVRQDGVIRSRVIACEDGTRVNWRWWPAGGSIVVRTPSEKVVIHLDNFTTAEREELIRFFRETFAKEIQENWPRFEQRTRRPSPPRRLTSRGGILATALVLMGFSPLFVWCWFAGLGVQYLLIGVTIAVAAICCLWRLRAFKER